MKQIPLTNTNFFALVDDSDFDWLNQWKWYWLREKDKPGYARRSEYIGKIDGKYRRKEILMHREINKTPKGIITDHRDLNGLNNQRYNLRDATYSESARNRSKKRTKNSSSKYTGVFFDKEAKKYRADIQIHGKRILLGRFKCEDDAAKAYNKAAVEHFGEFALLNEVDNG